MADDRDIARRALDMQVRARDFRLLDLPGYVAWSKRKLAEGQSEALIAHMDATCMCLPPEDVENISVHDFEEMFEEMFDDLKSAIDGDPTTS